MIEFSSGTTECGVLISLEQTLDYPNAVGEPAALSDTGWTGKRDIVLSLTGSEFTRLFSACYVGSRVVYPEESHAVLFLLWGAVEYPVTTIATFDSAVFDSAVFA